MTRTKQYLRNLGIKFDCDYPYLPYTEGGNTLETTYLTSVNNHIYVVVSYTSLTLVYELERTGHLRMVEEREWDEANEGIFEYSDYEREEAYALADEYYTPSATAGDYSPSHPWDAPGMSISDFI